MIRTVVSKLRRILPRTVRPHRIRGGPLRGCLIHASWQDYPRAILGRAEPELIEWFQANVEPGETWLDVGAHYGYTALALSRLVGEDGRVFAFEPVIGTAGHLARTRAANALERLVVVPLALGDERKLTLVRDVCLYRGMAQMTATSVAGEGVVSVALDCLWPGLCGNDTTVSGVKIDVQGLEVAVLRGMVEILRRQRPKLVVEYHGQADLEALLQVVDDAGYRRDARPLEAPRAGEDDARFRHARNYEFHVAD